ISIDFMFGTIRKHQTWLWAVIITIMIVSLVFFFSQSRMNNGPRAEMNYGSINGEKITQEEFGNATREVQLSYLFKGDEARRSGLDLEREIYQWLLLLQRADKMGIHVSTEDVARVAQQMLFQFQKQGITSPQIFIQQVLRP